MEHVRGHIGLSARVRGRVALALLIAMTAVGLPLTAAVVAPAPVAAVPTPVVVPATITVGTGFSCGITTAGGAVCWGANSFGQLGRGAAGTATPTVAAVTGLGSGVTAIAAGGSHVCAVVSGAAWCWGSNLYGQLGNGTTSSTPTASPMAVTGLDAGVTAISAGAGHTCAVVSGAARCWGANPFGQIGDGSTADRSSSVGVSDLDQGVTGIAAGERHTCAIQDGAALCWGHNQYGEVGDGSTVQRLEPVQAGDLDAGVTAISAGSGHTCAVRSDAALCWGRGSSGQMGNGTTSGTSTPAAVSGLGSGVTTIAAGGSSTCAVVSGGARCWGKDDVGQVGDRSFQPALVPVTPVGLAEDVSAIAVGVGHGCAVISEIARCWGSNTSGQLGRVTGSSSSPLPAYPLAGVTDLGDGGANHACAVVSGAARCWGSGATGQIGDGGTANRPSPVPVTGLATGTTAIATGLSSSCAVVTGQAWCWGEGSNGKLGWGQNGASAVAVPVSGLTTGVTAITVGTQHACAVVSGAAKCWGSNWAGQLGDGSTTSSNVPVQVAGLTSGVTAIDAGDGHTCAVVSGTAMCWGNNTSGRLGNGSAASSMTPGPVVGLTSDVTAISAGIGTTCAIVSGGARCWGGGSGGRLGNGSTTTSLVPVQVTGLITGVTAIATGPVHVCAVVSGSAQCWGTGGSGQLGHGSTAAASAPAQVVGLTDGVTDIAVGETSTCALVTEALRCWGAGTTGQLAQDEWAPTPIDSALTFLVPSSAPVNTPPAAIPSSISVSRGGTHSFALAGADPDGDPLTFAVVDQPSKGSLWCSPSGDCIYSSWPFTMPGPDSFSFTVDDGTATSTPATVSITIVNAPPTAHDSAVTAQPGGATQIQLSGSDPDGDLLTFSAAPSTSKGSLSCSPSGSCTYTPYPWAAGNDSFTFTVSDSETSSAPATVWITIANRAPVASPTGATVDAGAPTSIDLPASDPDGDPLICFTTPPSKGTVTGGGSCTKTYTSSAGQPNDGVGGSDVFSYNALDLGGMSPSAAVSITIVNPDLALTSSHTGSFAPGEGTGTYTLTVTNSDTAPAHGTTTIVDTLPAGLTFRSVATDASGFDCSGTEVGATTVTCTRGETVPEGASLVVELTVDVAAGAGSSVTNEAVVSSLYELASTAADNTAVDPTSLNSRPTIADVATATELNTAIDVATPGDDPDGDALTYAVVDQPDHGTLSGEGATRRYTPARGFKGIDTFTIAVTDTGGLVSNPATVTVHVGVREVRGVVTDAVTGDPLAGVQVTLYRTTGIAAGPAVGTVTSAADGTYDLGALYPQLGGVPSGRYAIRWADPAHRHVTEWHTDAPDRASGTDTVIAASADPLARDAALTPLARVSGTVTGAGGANLDGIQVRIVPAGGSGGTVATTVGGAYAVEGLPAGDYQVWFRNVGTTGHLSEWWDESPTQAGSDVITLTDGQSLDLDEELAPVAAPPTRGTIAGTVTAEADGSPIAGVQVRLYPEPYTGSAAATTAADGTYRFEQRVAGSYKLYFRDVAGRSWVSEHNGDSADLASAPPVILAGGQTRTVDAALASVAAAPVRDASVGGTVTGPDGQPIAGLQVRLYVAGETASAATTTAADGTYAFTRRLPGEYQLFFRDLTGTWVSEWSGDAAAQANAGAVTMTSGGHTTVNATLALR